MCDVGLLIVYIVYCALMTNTSVLIQYIDRQQVTYKHASKHSS